MFDCTLSFRRGGVCALNQPTDRPHLYGLPLASFPRVDRSCSDKSSAVRSSCHRSHTLRYSLVLTVSGLRTPGRLVGCPTHHVSGIPSPASPAAYTVTWRRQLSTRLKSTRSAGMHLLCLDHPSSNRHPSERDTEDDCGVYH